MDCPCGKFCDRSFSRFGFIIMTDRQAESHTDADERLTHATIAGVSNNNKLIIIIIIIRPICFIEVVAGC